MRVVRPVLGEELEADRPGLQRLELVDAVGRRPVPHEVGDEALGVAVPGEDVPWPCRILLNLEVAEAPHVVEHFVVHQDLQTYVSSQDCQDL